MVAAPYSTADFLHGPIAIVEPGFPILAIAPSGPTLEGIRELLERASEADITVITDAELPGRRIALEAVPEALSPLVAVIPAQQLAVGAAEAPRQGRRPPDRPQEGDADLMTQTGIRIDGVTKAYKNGPRAVDDVSLEVRQGEFMVLVGPSGCGKSTLLKLIAGIEETTDGHDPHRRARRHPPGPAQARHRDGLPELRALPAPERAREPRLRPQAAQDLQGRDRQARRRGGEDPRPGGDARAQAGRALRRPAPARGDGPRDRARAAGLPDGRAALEPRRQAARLDARAALAPARAPRGDDGLRHPRPGRGDDARPARRGHARRRAAAVRHARDAVRASREPVRGRVHRLAGDEPRRGERRGRRGALRRLPRAARARLAAARRDRARHPPARPQARGLRHRRPRAGRRAARDRDPRGRGHRRARACAPARSRRRSTPPPTTTSCWPRTTAPRSRS